MGYASADSWAPLSAINVRESFVKWRSHLGVPRTVAVLSVLFAFPKLMSAFRRGEPQQVVSGKAARYPTNSGRP